MKEKYRCTIVVSSCDTYDDTWELMFKTIEKHWPDRPYPIVLNTESKSFDYSDMNIKTFNFYKKGEKSTWGERLIKTLENINTEYIIFLLDDFFLLGPVDQKRIEQCILWMDEDPNIAVFSFWRNKPPNIKDGKYPHFEKRPQIANYRLNCQAALWKREKLISYIRPHENPWQWERYGSKRSSRYKEDFYSAIEGEPYIFNYNFEAGGGVHRGKWTEGVDKLFKEYDIKVDLTKRGIEEKSKPLTPKSQSLFVKKWKSRLYRLKNIVVEWKSLKK